MFKMLPSEIKKAEAFARKITGKADCRVGGYFVSRKDGDTIATFECEILSNGYEDREQDVIIEAFLPDRRRSWAHERY